MWPGDDSKDKGDGTSGARRRFDVGMDGRPVRFPMTDEVFAVFRRRLLEAPNSDVVSVSRFDEKTVQIVTRGNGAASPATMQLIGELVLEFSIGNSIAIQPEQP